MSWVVKLTEDAQASIKDLPARVRRQIGRLIDELERDRFSGDVKPLKGKAWENCYRKRSGDYRIIYTVNRGQRLVYVLLVLRRSEKTCR